MPPSNIVLVGFMGSGKSSIGRLLARRLDFDFVDTDRLIIERAGTEISEIFARHGEDHFRDLESAAIESLRGAEGKIIATGGGAVLREKNRASLRELGLVVGLTASEDVIFERVSRNSKRPLLQTENPRATVHALLAAREPLYREAAQLTIDTTRLSHDDVADRILAEARDRFSWNGAA